MTTAYSGDGITFPDNSVQATAPRVGMVNRIINGDMRIDQRNAGAAVTITSTGAPQYTVDRFYGVSSVASKFTVQQNAGSITPPIGFTNYLGATSSSAYSMGSGDYFAVGQQIEGFNIADLGWGTANAKTATLSFWVYSSLTGTFGGALRNNTVTRSYPFSYTIATANTWTQISVTIAGETTGTWVTNNGIGIQLWFGLGVGSTYSGTAGSWAAGNYVSATGATSVVGTSGATFYITGVQLEKGSTATDFEYVDYGRQLALCQRYTYTPTLNAVSASTSLNGNQYFVLPFPVVMRATPTYAIQSGAWGGSTPTNDGASNGNIRFASGSSFYATGGVTLLLSAEL